MEVFQDAHRAVSDRMHACTHLPDVQKRADARFIGTLRTIPGRSSCLGANICKKDYFAAPSAGRACERRRPPACRRSPVSQHMCTSPQEEQARLAPSAILGARPPAAGQSPSSHTLCSQFVAESPARWVDLAGKLILSTERRAAPPSGRLAPALDLAGAVTSAPTDAAFDGAPIQPSPLPSPPIKMPLTECLRSVRLHKDAIMAEKRPPRSPHL